MEQPAFQDYHSVIASVNSPVGNPVSQNLPCRLNLLKPSDIENKICDKWASYMDWIHRDKFLLVNDDTQKVLVRRRLWSSRYHKSGQEKIKRKIIKRLGHYYHKNGVLLGLTFRRDISRSEAWSIVNDSARGFMDGLNKWRASRGFKKRLSYFKVNEPHQDGYPHCHIVFPGLRYLAPIPVIERLWSHGSTSVKYSGGIRPASYACKYISKMCLSPLTLAYYYYFNLRGYSFSRSYVYKKIDGLVDSGWRYVPASGFFGVKEKAMEYLNQGFIVSGLYLLDTS